MPVLAFLTSVAVISIFIIPVLLTQRHGYRRAQDYFVSSDHVLPKVIQNSSIAYAIGLGHSGLLRLGRKRRLPPAILHSVLFDWV
jgi:hypothetical protein